MNIAYLGAGTWGTALASLLANKKNKVVVWDRNNELIKHILKFRSHPKLENFKIPENIVYTNNMNEAVEGADLIVESVTAQGIRPVFESIKSKINSKCRIILTSKGIEQKTGLLLPEILLEVLGEKAKNQIGCLSGPSHAEEVIKNLPTSVVCSSYDSSYMKNISDVFTNPTFRVYPNADILGISFGGAMKNIIAIACGISDGLMFGDNAKAALMTRGLHEMRKLSKTKNCNPLTLNGLSGLGDLFVTCASTLSRNYQCGQLLAKGYTIDEAKEEIGMVVEGVYTCVSAYELGKKYNIPIPITNATYAILYENMSAKDAVIALMQREIKEEHL